MLLGYLSHDWVQLGLVVSIVNEVVGFDDRFLVTPEAKDFVTNLVLERKVIVGSLDKNGKFVKWLGSPDVLLKRVLNEMPAGMAVDQKEEVWFDSSDADVS